MTDKLDDIQLLLNSIPDTFDMLEEGIDFQIQKEYIEFSHNPGRVGLIKNDTVKLGKVIFSNKVEIEAKKQALNILGHLGTISAFRLIEKYYKNPDKELKQWSALALQECRMLLESMLTDQTTGFISSGLGGLNNSLRYYFLLIPNEGRPFTIAQKNIIKDELSFIAKYFMSIVESVDLSDSFVGITALVSMDIAIGTLIEKGIKQCNELGDFVFEYYYVTNENIPTEVEITEIIKLLYGEA